MPILELSGGMNNVLHPATLPDNVQAKVKNVAFDSLGRLAIIREEELQETITAAIFEEGHAVRFVFQWFPATLPSNAFIGDAYKDVFVVFYYTDYDTPDQLGKVKLVYRTGATTYYRMYLDTEPIAIAEVIADADSWQFVFVDGRLNHQARRISISPEGTPSVTTLGMSPIYKRPEIVGIEYSNEDERGTGIGQGCAFGYRYSLRNEYGERSPMSPLTVFDLLDFYKRGTITDGEYSHDTTPHGSLKTITVRCLIPQDAVWLDLFRFDSDGVETDAPVMAERLVRSISVKGAAGILDVTDSHPYAAAAANLLQDDSPKADYVALSNASLFFANAVNNINIPYVITSITKIIIYNNNPLSYINRYVEFDLFDDNLHPEATSDYVPEDIANLNVDNYRFLDSDMKTALETYVATPAAESYKLSDQSAVETNMMVKVRIPVMPAYLPKIIFLIVTADSIDPNIIDNPPVPLNTVTISQMYERMPISPVKSANTLIAVSEVSVAQIAPSVNHNYPLTWTRSNKANKNFDPSETVVPASLALPTVDTVTDGGTISAATGTSYGPLSQWKEHPGITYPRTGQASIWVKVPAVATLEKIVIQVQEEFGDGRFPILQLRIVRDTAADNNTTIRILVWDDQDQSDLQAELVIPQELEETPIDRLYFICMTWRYIDTDPDVNKHECFLHVLYHDGDKWKYEYDTQGEKEGEYDLDETPADIRVSTELELGQTGSPLIVSQFVLQQGIIIEHAHQFFAMARQFPVFIDEAIGIDYETTQEIDPGHTCFENKNIVFEPMVAPTADNRPGRIIWTSQQEYLSTNEHNINHDIAVILPSKSMQPTDEHNTLLIWADDKIKRMVFEGTVPIVIDEMANVSIYDKHRFIRIPFGCAWIGKEGIWMMQNGQIQNLTKGRMNIPDIENKSLVYNKDTNSVHVINAHETSEITPSQPVPQLSVTPAFLDFGTVLQGNSAYRMYYLWGANLLGNVTITSNNSEFKLNRTYAGLYTETLTVIPIMGGISTPIYVKGTGGITANVDGTIDHDTDSVDTVTVATSMGTVSLPETNMVLRIENTDGVEYNDIDAKVESWQSIIQGWTFAPRGSHYYNEATHRPKLDFDNQAAGFPGLKFGKIDGVSAMTGLSKSLYPINPAFSSSFTLSTLVLCRESLIMPQYGACIVGIQYAYQLSNRIVLRLNLGGSQGGVKYYNKIHMITYTTQLVYQRLIFDLQGINLIDGNWHLITVKFSNGTSGNISLYIDGTLVDSQNASLRNSTDEKMFSLGRAVDIQGIDYATDGYEGSMLGTWVWNTLQTDPQIQQMIAWLNAKYSLTIGQ